MDDDEEKFTHKSIVLATKCKFVRSIISSFWTTYRLKITTVFYLKNNKLQTIKRNNNYLGIEILNWFAGFYKTELKKNQKNLLQKPSTFFSFCLL